MKTIAILIPVLTLLLAHRTELRAADVAAKTATDSLDPAAPTTVSRYAVDRSGQRPMRVFTAPGHCAWPNLKLLDDAACVESDGCVSGNRHRNDALLLEPTISDRPTAR